VQVESGSFERHGQADGARTVFIDGSDDHQRPSAQAKNVGQGTLILTGTFMMKNALMCVKTTGNGNGTHCDTATGA
jgi:hypothetical protein